MARKNNLKKRKERFVALVKSEQEAEEKKEKKKIDRFNKKRQREEEMISIEEDTNNIFMEDLKPKERREPRKKLKGKRTSLKPKETGMEGVEKTIIFTTPDSDVNMKIQAQELKPLSYMQAKKRRKGPRAANLE